MAFDPMYIWLGVAPRCQEKFLRFQEASAWTCFLFVPDTIIIHHPRVTINQNQPLPSSIINSCWAPSQSSSKWIQMGWALAIIGLHELASKLVDLSGLIDDLRGNIGDLL